MRNIVLVTIDSLRADHCSFMGYERKTTPTMDKMAKNGLYFENVIASSVATAPSMYGVFTGDYSSLSSTNFQGKSWRKEIKKRKTIAELLREKGYKTIAIQGNPRTSSYFGFDKGFQKFEYIAEGNISENNLIKRKIRNFLKRMKEKSQLGIAHDIETIFLGKRVGLDSKLILRKIKELKKGIEEPFFLWLFLLDTHTPYTPPKNKKTNIVKKYLSTFRTLYLNYLLSRNQRNANRIGNRAKDEIISLYDACIHYSDRILTDIIKELDELDPIYIVHADHGEGFGEHGYYVHPPYLYEDLIHVPLIIYNSNVRKNKVKKPVSLRTMPKTILRMAGIKQNGSPLQPFLEDDNKWVLSELFDDSIRKSAVRGVKWKFIEKENRKSELYNLENDPCERCNLIKKRPKLATEMKKILRIKRKKLEKQRVIKRIEKFNQ